MYLFHVELYIYLSHLNINAMSQSLTVYFHSYSALTDRVLVSGKLLIDHYEFLDYLKANLHEPMVFGEKIWYDNKLLHQNLNRISDRLTGLYDEFLSIPCIVGSTQVIWERP